MTIVNYQEVKEKNESNRKDILKEVKGGKELMELLHIFRQTIPDEEKVMFFSKELVIIGQSIYVKRIADNFGWSLDKTSRIVDSLVEKKYLDKTFYCPACGESYEKARRIPISCTNPSCSTILVRSWGSFAKKSNLPQFLLKLNDKGAKFVSDQIDLYAKAFCLMKIKLKGF